MVLTVLIALEKGEYHSEEVYKLLVDLARRLLGKGFGKLKIKRLLHFLSTYVYFDNKEMFVSFEKEIATFIDKEDSMGITELATMLIREDGREMGREEGMEKGMEEGIELGREKEKVSFISYLLLESNHSLQEIANITKSSTDFVIGVKSKLPVVEK